VSILTVVTPATKFDLTVLATVKEELGIATLDTTHDAQLARLIHEASIACATYCDLVFAEEAVAETFRLTCSTDTLLLARRPVSTVTSIAEDGVALAAADYAVDAVKGFLYRLDGDGGLSTWSGSKIVVTYTGGYALLDSLPRDIERACISLIKTMFFQTTRDPLVRSVDVPGVMAETFWVGSIGDNGALPPNVTALLNPYRRLYI
jgi:hypothetical protein